MIAAAKSGTAGFAPIFSFYLIVHTSWIWIYRLSHAYMIQFQDASNCWLIDDFCIMHFIFLYFISICQYIWSIIIIRNSTKSDKNHKKGKSAESPCIWYSYGGRNGQHRFCPLWVWYCTISNDSSPLGDCDTPDEIFVSSPCQRACDRLKFSSGVVISQPNPNIIA